MRVFEGSVTQLATTETHVFFSDGQTIYGLDRAGQLDAWANILAGIPVQTSPGTNYMVQVIVIHIIDLDIDIVGEGMNLDLITAAFGHVPLPMGLLCLRCRSLSIVNDAWVKFSTVGQI